MSNSRFPTVRPNDAAEVEPARVGVQHGHCPGFTLQLPVVPAEGLDRRQSGGEQRGVDGSRLPERQGTQFAGQGEGQQEILGRHLEPPLAFQPAFALGIRTLFGNKSANLYSSREMTSVPEPPWRRCGSDHRSRQDRSRGRSGSPGRVRWCWVQAAVEDQRP